MKFMKTTFIIMGLLFFNTCDLFQQPDNDKPKTEEPISLSAPIISPPGQQTQNTSLTITITTDNLEGNIYYTLDGSTPTKESNLYQTPFNILAKNSSVKAICYSNGEYSDVSNSTYQLSFGLSENQKASITGTVKLPTGIDYPLNEVNIYTSENPNRIINPDTDGFFVMDGLDPTIKYTIYFTTSDVGIVRGSTRGVDGAAVSELAKQLTDVEATEGSGYNLNSVTLKPTGSIRLQAGLVDRLGDYATDNTGIIAYIPGTGFSGFTDVSGNLNLIGIPEGIYTIRVEKTGYTYQELIEINVVSELETDLTENQLLLYYGSGTVMGSAVYSDSNVSGESQSYEGINVLLKNIIDSTITYTTSTDTVGSYSFTNVEPGNYFIQFAASSYQSQVVEDVTVIGAKVSVVDTVYLVPIGGSMSGSVTLSDAEIEGIDHSGITLLAEEVNSGRTYSSTTNQDGEFLFPNLMAGSYNIIASRVGYSTRKLINLTIISGQELSNVLFDPLTQTDGTLTGIVTLEGGSDCSGIDVLATHTSSSTTVYNTITDENGVYIISDMIPGNYRLQLSYAGYLSSSDIEISITDDRVVEAESAVLQSNKARISGLALLESGDDHTGITVLVIRQNSEIPFTVTATTDNQGNFYVSNLEPGDYKLQVSKDGYQTTNSPPITISSGSTDSNTSLTLPISTRSITGQINLEGVTNFSGVKITATNLDETSLIYSALTNSAGYYALASMEPGQYLLSYSKENYVDFSPETVNLDSSSTTNISLETLQLQKGIITGIVNLEGRSNNSGIEVSIPGTDLNSLTDASGTYSFEVPAGNYPGGVRFELIDFQTSADTETITVLNNSTYAVATHMLTATHNTITGFVDLEGTDDESDITVSLDNTEYSIVTDATGDFQFDNVLLGDYTIRLTRENTPSVTAAITVIPSGGINVGTITMRPDSASIEGFVGLTGMSDFSNIDVTVTTVGESGTLTTQTSYDGSFYLGNLLATGSHSITFSKIGWDEQSIVVNDLTPLEVRDLSSYTIELFDSLAPVINTLSINDGSNITSDANVAISIIATEYGSGIERMQISWDGVFDQTVPWEPYTPTFSRDLPGNGNGTKDLYLKLKDEAGNISDVVNTSILLSDQVKTYAGVLGVDDLHWIASEGVVIVAGNILIESGSTLTIDEGVEIRFAGNYYISVEGTISANGSANLPIIFTTTDDYNGSWSGIDSSGSLYVSDDYNYNLIAGSEITYAQFFNCDPGVKGKILVKNSYFETAGYALNEFTGHLIKSDVYGSLSTQEATLFNNRIYGRASTGWVDNSGRAYSGDTVDYYMDEDGNYHWNQENIYGYTYDYVLETDIYFRVYPSTELVTGGDTSIYRSFIVNNLFKDMNRLYISNSYEYGEFRNNTVTEIFQLDIEGTKNFYNLDISEISTTISSPDGQFVSITNSNIYNIWDSTFIDINTSRDNTKEYNFQNNFWGYDKTQELDSSSENSNISFIEDYYDNFETSKLNYNNWASDPWEQAGYLGDIFVDFSIDITGGAVEVYNDEMTNSKTYEAFLGAPVTLELTALTNSTINRYRIAQNTEELLTSSWSSYFGEFDYDFDVSKLNSGNLDLFVQVEDDNGNLSAVFTKVLPCDNPLIENISILEGSSYSNESSVELSMDLKDNGYLKRLKVTINGFQIFYDDMWGTSNTQIINLNIPQMADGDYILEITAQDRAGKITVETRNFSINKGLTPGNYGEGVTWNNDGTLIKDSDTAYLWDFDNISDLGKETVGNSAHSITVGSSSSGLGTYAANYIYSSDNIPYNIINNAFTIEYWYKSSSSSSSVNIEKYSVFNTGFNESTFSNMNFHLTGADSESSYCDSRVDALNFDIWHHYAYVYNGDQILMYRDGILTDYNNTTITELNSNDNKLYINSNIDSYIDELRISNIARTADELRSYVEFTKPLLP